MMRYWLVKNAMRTFDQGITPEVCVLEGGGWWGVYATDKEEEIAVMDKLAESCTSGVSSTTEEEYNTLRSQKKSDRGANPISPILRESPPIRPQLKAAPPVEVRQPLGNTSEVAADKSVVKEEDIKVEKIELSRKAIKPASKTASKKTTDK